MKNEKMVCEIEGVTCKIVPASEFGESGTVAIIAPNGVLLASGNSISQAISKAKDVLHLNNIRFE